MKIESRLRRLEKKFAVHEPEAVIFFLYPWENFNERYEEYLSRGGDPNAPVLVYRYTLAVRPDTPLEDIPEKWRSGELDLSLNDKLCLTRG